MARNRGCSMSANQVRRLSFADVGRLLEHDDLALAVNATLAVMRSQAGMIDLLEKAVKSRIKRRPEFKPLLSVSGIGDILGLTIWLESGDIHRFKQVGNYASYCRCVNSTRITNGKKKGQGNRKNGNKYLAWAYVEAANFAVRYNSQIKRYYQRKSARTNGIVAIKTVAHKLARACYYILRDHVPFDVDKAFA